MVQQFFRTVLAGFIAGLVVFILPFALFRIFLAMALMGLVFKLLRPRGSHGYRSHHPFARRFEGMSEEERNEFMAKFGRRCGFTPPPASTTNA